MDGNRQGVDKEKRTFAGEVKICVPAGRSSLNGLSRERDQRGLTEENAGQGWMDGHRQGVDEEKRAFAGEVKFVCQQGGACCRLDDEGRGPAQGAAWFEFSSCYELRDHGLCRQNRSALWWIIASIHGVDEN